MTSLKTKPRLTDILQVWLWPHTSSNSRQVAIVAMPHTPSNGTLGKDLLWITSLFRLSLCSYLYCEYNAKAGTRGLTKLSVEEWCVRTGWTVPREKLCRHEEATPGQQTS